MQTENRAVCSTVARPPRSPCISFWPPRARHPNQSNRAATVGLVVRRHIGASMRIWVWSATVGRRCASIWSRGARDFADLFEIKSDHFARRGHTSPNGSSLSSVSLSRTAFRTVFLQPLATQWASGVIGFDMGMQISPCSRAPARYHCRIVGRANGRRTKGVQRPV
jgi:hypothetical protein